MTFEKTVTLKDGRNCLLRNGVTSDGKAVLDVFNRTHEETDYLLTYSDENRFTASQEADFLQRKTDSANNVEIIAVVDDVVAGTAGLMLWECGIKSSIVRFLALPLQRSSGDSASESI